MIGAKHGGMQARGSGSETEGKGRTRGTHETGEGGESGDRETKRADRESARSSQRKGRGQRAEGVRKKKRETSTRERRTVSSGAEGRKWGLSTELLQASRREVGGSGEGPGAKQKKGKKITG